MLRGSLTREFGQNVEQVEINFSPALSLAVVATIILLSIIASLWAARSEVPRP